jgi:hypothetical protein
MCPNTQEDCGKRQSDKQRVCRHEHGGWYGWYHALVGKISEHTVERFA